MNVTFFNSKVLRVIYATSNPNFFYTIFIPCLVTNMAQSTLTPKLTFIRLCPARTFSTFVQPDNFMMYDLIYYIINDIVNEYEHQRPGHAINVL